MNELESTEHPLEWPKNWREIADRMVSCDRCGTTLFDRLFCLSERFHTIHVCRHCSMDYHNHCKIFADDIIKRKFKKN